MAIGNLSGFAAGDVNRQIGADASWLRGLYDNLNRKVLEYQTVFGATPATAIAALEASPYTFSAGDATAIVNLVVDMNNVKLILEGIAVAAPRDARVDCVQAMGIV